MILAALLLYAPVVLCLGIAAAARRRAAKAVWAAVGIGILAIVIASGHVGSEHSAAVEVGGAKLTYSIRWGWDMEQAVGISGPGWLDWGSRLSEDVWDKPYNAGGPLFSNADGTVYHLALQWNIYRIGVAERTVEARCDGAELVRYVGTFGLAEHQQMSRGDGARFTPAGQDPPVPPPVPPNLDALRERCS